MLSNSFEHLFSITQHFLTIVNTTIELINFE